MVSIPILALVSLFLLAANCCPPSFKRSHQSCPSGCKCDDGGWMHIKGYAIDCSRLRLSNIPHDLPTNVEMLDVSKNEFKTLSSLSQHTALKTLDLGSNQLGDDGANHLSRFTTTVVDLKLSSNQISRIPSQLPPSLTHLYLDENVICILSCTSINQLPPLITLSLRRNLVRTIGKDSFCNEVPPPLAKTLTHLDLSENKIVTIEEQGFKCLTVLQNLNLSGNHLRGLRLGDFEGLDQLEVLDLSSNALIQVANGMFLFMTHLKFLSLARNKLTVAPLYLPPMDVLDLRSNGITTLQEDPSLLQVKSVLVADNPLTCDCHLQWIKDHLIKSARLKELRKGCDHTFVNWIESMCEDDDGLMPRCTYPRNLTGVRLDKVAQDDFERCDTDRQQYKQKQCTQWKISKHNPPRRSAKLQLDVLPEIQPDPVCLCTEAPVSEWVRANAVNSTTIVVEWDLPPAMKDYSSFYIEHYIFGHRRCAIRTKVSPKQQVYHLNRLRADTDYMICVVPYPCRDSNVRILLDFCFEIRTPPWPFYHRLMQKLVGTGTGCCTSSLGFVLLSLLFISILLMSGHVINTVWKLLCPQNYSNGRSMQLKTSLETR